MGQELEEIARVWIAREGKLNEAVEKVKSGIMKCFYIDRIIAVYKLSRFFRNVYCREQKG